MYSGRYEGKHRKAAAPVHGKALRTGRLATMVIATVLLLALAIGGTVAWLSTKGDPIINTFNPSEVACQVEESFDKTTGEKRNVNVTNTGDTTAYIRVKLVTYRTNDAGQHIGGTATIPSFTLGENWVEFGGYYYYTLPVAAGEKPATNLTETMTLTSSYSDADGGHQAIDVMAEAIQSEPARAVGQAWGVSISQGSVTAYSGN